MGCSKNYVMYWGFYENDYTIKAQIIVHKLHKNGCAFLCIFTQPLKQTLKFLPPF